MINSSSFCFESKFRPFLPISANVCLEGWGIGREDSGKIEKMAFLHFCFYLFIYLIFFISHQARVYKGKLLVLELFCKCVSCDEDASFFPKDRLPDNLDRADFLKMGEVAFASGFRDVQPVGERLRCPEESESVFGELVDEGVDEPFLGW